MGVFSRGGRDGVEHGEISGRRFGGGGILRGELRAKNFISSRPPSRATVSGAFLRRRSGGRIKYRLCRGHRSRSPLPFLPPCCSFRAGQNAVEPPAPAAAAPAIATRSPAHSGRAPSPAWLQI